jgi:hypothetical protein
MIQSISKGRGFSGAASYVLEKEEAQLIGGSMASQTPRALALEAKAFRELNPKLGRACFHASLSLADGETLTDEQWNTLAERYMTAMGFENAPYLVARHTDTEHDHIHIVAVRIDKNGKTVSDSQDYARGAQVVQEIEQDYGLQRGALTPPQAREQGIKAPIQGELHQALRTETPSLRMQLQALVQAAARDQPTFTQFAQRLEASGVEIVPNVARRTRTVSGISYRLDNALMKGSDLGKAFSFQGLQTHLGVSYEPDRDFESVNTARERAAARAFGLPDREREASQTPERRGASRNAGTLSPSHGCTSRRNTADLSRDSERSQSVQRSITPTIQRSSEVMPRRGERGPQGHPQPEPGRTANGVEALRPSGTDGPDYGGARDRVLALAGTAQNLEHTEPARSGRVAKAGADRTATAIQRQTTALGVERFEIGIRDTRTGQMMNRAWSRTEIEKNTAWLKRMNARGNDVYIRPAGEHSLVLVDDLKANALERMKANGWAPAATVETSPGNYQAWVKLADQPIPAALRQAIARELAQTYGGDLNSADSRHYGRLAGFTNQKPQHTRDGRQPYVLAHECSGKVARSAPEALEHVGHHLDRVEAQKARETRLATLRQTLVPAYPYSPIYEYQRQAKRLLDHYGESTDLSRMDWMIATDMAKGGRFTRQDIEKALRECSPNIESRKTGHIDDYAKRTADKAWNAPDVLEHQRQAERAAERDQGPEISL